MLEISRELHNKHMAASDIRNLVFIEGTVDKIMYVCIFHFSLRKFSKTSKYWATKSIYRVL